MKNYVICPVGHYRETRPDATYPKVVLYLSGGYVDKGTLGGWTFVIVRDGIAIPPAMEADTQIIIIPENELDTTLTNQQRQRANQFFQQTDLNVTVAQGQTYRQVFANVGVALGQSADFMLTI